MAVRDVPKGPIATHAVQDLGGVMGPEYVALTRTMVIELERQTSAELAVITVDHLNGLPADAYSNALFQHLGPGKRDRNNGVLLLFARDDRRVRIETGYGLEALFTDARAGALLDQHAVPHFKAGTFGRGMYETARAIATTVAQAQGVTLILPDPATWPQQVPLPSAARSTAASPHPTTHAATADAYYRYYLLGTLLFAMLVLGGQAANIHFTQSKRRKEHAIGSGLGFGTTLWLGSTGWVMAAAIADHTLLPALGVAAGISSLLTWLHAQLRARWRRAVANYRLPCAQCRAPMALLSESADDAFLSADEQLEEKLRGMDYEVWHCAACNRTQRFEIPLPQALPCPQCRRRTIVKTGHIVDRATATASGRKEVVETCKNPRCHYTRRYLETLPALGSRTSGSRTTGPIGGGGFSGGGASSGPSFGGGRSGGGGAGRSW
ncbi:MAG: TPM domain-containing protein [Deltaproteobacteria bacterium]|nr:TPM domain-containing protein [Deltaproteobacteria bacterium]